MRNNAHAYNRILKVARTIADLAASPSVQTHHLAEASTGEIGRRGEYKDYR